MPTKRTTQTNTPKTAATKPHPAENPKTDTPAASPINDTAAPRFYGFPEPEDLTRTHELIVDAVTTMLTHGGHPDDVDTFLHAVMAHTRRRTFSQLVDDEAQMGTYVQKFIREQFNEWKTDLTVGWRKNKFPEQPQVTATSVTDRIRMNVRETVEGQFVGFMNEASPEEIRFLNEVFTDWDSRHLVAESRSDEIYLGMAFEYQLSGTSRGYIRIPERMMKQVQKYVDALRAIEDKEVV
jgi:hypothetical protein